MLTRKNIKPVFYGLVLAVSFGFGVAKANAVQNEWVVASTDDGTYCHLKFPAITESTLFTDRPQLEDPGSANSVDYYGVCDHDPLGSDEIQSQRLQWQRNNEADEG
jgi:hypothetical protein